MASVLPDAAVFREASSVQFRISQDMVTRFAALTGDRSGLHMSDDFARRSAYRRPVVHGMLPVGFLCLLKPFQVKGFRCVPVGLTGRFLAPVHAGDRLTLRADAGRPGSDDRTAAFDFEIVEESSGAKVTRGTATVRYDRAAGRENRRAASPGGGMLLRPVALNLLRLEDIRSGMRDRLAFRIERGAVSEFLELLAAGVNATGDRGVAEVSRRFYLPNLLSVLLFSTSVGVSLPGAWATFLEFAARAQGQVQLDTVYTLEGEIVHHSPATRIVKKAMAIREAESEDGSLLDGKVAALVNEPSRAMPTMDDLKGSAMDRGLAGKVVLITGASRGIGETTAKLFALAGAKVIVNYRQGAADANRVVQEIAQAGGEAVAIGADVTRRDEVQALVQRGVERFGAIHVLVNNAVRDYRPVPFLTLSWEEIQQDLDVIAKGAFLCCKQVVPLMLQQGGGKIVNLSSVAVDDPPPGQTKYVMAKGALVALTRSLSVELASHNIQVNLVVPSFVETDLVAHVQEGYRKKLARETPMGRHATAVEVAQAVLFLASAQSSFTTGQKIMVTGGGAPYA